jgi:hypothetical protein
MFQGFVAHNSEGCFNVVMWRVKTMAISYNNLIDVSDRLRRASLKCSDFESVIDKSKLGDLYFLIRPISLEKKICILHIIHMVRLPIEIYKACKCLKRATARGVQWAMTTSSNIDITHNIKQKDMLLYPYKGNWR